MLQLVDEVVRSFFSYEFIQRYIQYSWMIFQQGVHFFIKSALKELTDGRDIQFHYKWMLSVINIYQTQTKQR